MSAVGESVALPASYPLGKFLALPASCPLGKFVALLLSSQVPPLYDLFVQSLKLQNIIYDLLRK